MKNQFIRLFLRVICLIGIIPMIWLFSLYFAIDSGIYSSYIYDPDGLGRTDKINVGEKISIGRKARSVNFPPNCSKLSEELTQCILENKGSEILVAFPKSKGISPENAVSIVVLIIYKQDNLIVATIESAYKGPFFQDY